MVGCSAFSLFAQAVLVEWGKCLGWKLAVLSLQMPSGRRHISMVMQSRNFLFAQLTICMELAPSAHLCVEIGMLHLLNSL